VSLDPSLTDSSGLPAPKVTYTLAKNSIDLTHFHVDRAVESMEAAGARAVTSDVLLPHSGWHLMGTARMGDDPKTSVVNRWSQSHDVANLFIVDASQFVTSSGVNPTSTIAALALRAADHIVSSRSEIQVPA
jgi:choline dehydrogenase-like flavoprotein